MVEDVVLEDETVTNNTVKSIDKSIGAGICNNIGDRYYNQKYKEAYIYAEANL